MSLSQLMSIQKQRKLRRDKIFNEIYEKVKIRINHHVKFNKLNCIYTIPPIIYGCPHINKVEIANYIENKLVDQGFYTQRLTPVSIYINWEDSIVRYVKNENDKKRKMKKKDKEIDELNKLRNIELLDSIHNYES